MKGRMYKLAVFVTMMILTAFGIPLALSADANVARKESGLQSFPVEESTIIYKGAHVCVNTAGYLVAAAATDGLRYVGIAYEQADNSSGADGAINCRVYTEGVFLCTFTSISQAMVGRPMYIVDDATLDETATIKLQAGILVEYVSSTSGWVDIGQRTDALTGYQDHVYINTDLATKSVRLNNKTFTNTSGDITGARIAPRVGATTTGSVRGLEVIPGGSGGAHDYVHIQGVISECYINTSGNVSGVVRAFEGKVDSTSGYAGTITGPACVLKAFNDMHGTVTNGVFVIDVETHGGNKAWDGLAKLPDDDQIASYDEAGTSGTKAGWIKVKIGSNTRYIRTYDSGA